MSEAKFETDEGSVNAERDPSPGFASRSHPLPQGERVRAPPANYGAIEIGEKSTTQLFGCTKPLTFGLMARGATSWATYKNAASSTEAACSSASTASRAAGSKVWRAFVTNSSNLGLLM